MGLHLREVRAGNNDEPARRTSLCSPITTAVSTSTPTTASSTTSSTTSTASCSSSPSSSQSSSSTTSTSATSTSSSSSPQCTAGKYRTGCGNESAGVCTDCETGKYKPATSPNWWDVHGRAATGTSRRRDGASSSRLGLQWSVPGSGPRRGLRPPSWAPAPGGPRALPRRRGRLRARAVAPH